MVACRELLLVEFKLFVREPVAVFFTFIFPLIPLLLFGTLYGHEAALPGYRVIDVYVPALIAMVVGYLGLLNLPIAISEYRDQGILKRYQASPLPLGQFLAVHLLVHATLFVLVCAIIIVVASLVFGIRLEPLRNLPEVAGAAFVGLVATFTLGFAVAGLCRSARTTQALGSVLFFSMLFTSGATLPRSEFPDWLKRVTDYVPLTHVVDSLTGCWVGASLATYTMSFAYLGGIAAVGFLVTLLTFRWSY